MTGHNESDYSWNSWNSCFKETLLTSAALKHLLKWVGLHQEYKIMDKV